MVSLFRAPLTLPTFCTPGFQEFFRLGTAIRAVLPLANGGIAHLFAVYGCQEAESDPIKLAHSNKLMEAVLG